MTCDHCCFDCKEYGEDMSFEVFKKAVEYSQDLIAIGGGEPTIHPQFDKFLLYAITHTDEVWLATNGKLTDTALMLAKLAKKGVILCDLSQDIYHDPIDQVVIEAFTNTIREEKPSNDLRSIRNVTGKVLKAGRSKEGREGCPCEDFMIKPNGAIVQCGCLDSPVVGNVWNDENEDFWESDPGCWKWNNEF